MVVPNKRGQQPLKVVGTVLDRGCRALCVLEKEVAAEFGARFDGTQTVSSRRHLLRVVGNNVFIPERTPSDDDDAFLSPE